MYIKNINDLDKTYGNPYTDTIVRKSEVELIRSIEQMGAVVKTSGSYWILGQGEDVDYFVLFDDDVAIQDILVRNGFDLSRKFEDYSDNGTHFTVRSYRKNEVNIIVYTNPIMLSSISLPKVVMNTMLDYGFDISSKDFRKDLHKAFRKELLYMLELDRLKA